MNDGIAENMERLIVRLVNPTGGATLGNLNTTSVYVSDPSAASAIGFDIGHVEVTERGIGKIFAVVRRTGSAVGPASAAYSMTGGDATPGIDFSGNTTGTVSWADGDGNARVLEFTIADDGSGENNETFTLTLASPVGATIAATSSFVATILDGSGANMAPTAVAGISQTSASGTQVMLDGNQSNDPNNDLLSYQWAQTSGPSVSLNNAAAALASFTAPSVTSDTLLQFQLTVTDPGGLSDSATTTVTVTTSAVGGGGGSSSGGTPSPLLLLILLMELGRRRVATQHRP